MADGAVVESAIPSLLPLSPKWDDSQSNLERAMQFLAHLPLDIGVVAVFFCQNDPGMCDD
ncbi:hypothetical protein [Streptomyces sp. NPDC023838]|uniref:hypothetical protein n=1 Tax=Streptomyces sp. NPDC023838 TaxID=3154325 RepID=UPI0033E7A68B